MTTRACTQGFPENNMGKTIDAAVPGKVDAGRKQSQAVSFIR